MELRIYEKSLLSLEECHHIHINIEESWWQTVSTGSTRKDIEWMRISFCIRYASGLSSRSEKREDRWKNGARTHSTDYRTVPLLFIFFFRNISVFQFSSFLVLLFFIHSIRILNSRVVVDVYINLTRLPNSNSAHKGALHRKLRRILCNLIDSLNNCFVLVLQSYN